MTTTESRSTADRNTDLLRTAFEHLNARDLEACKALMLDDFAINLAGAPAPRSGLDVWQQGLEIGFAGFPDLHADIEDCFATEDKVAVRLTFRGTHTGEFLGVAPTGRTISYVSNELYRVADGKIAEEWIVSDLASLMHQITEKTPA